MIALMPDSLHFLDPLRALSPDPGLLGSGDGPPIEIVNRDGAAPALLICDHASSRVPAALDGLGLDAALLKLHVGWDIGIADVTRRLAARLDAPAVLAGFSRLVIDCNRRPGTPESIPEVSDGIDIPGNRGLGPNQRAARDAACFAPYHEAIAAVLARVRRPPLLVSLHSFTPVMAGVERPWQVGILWHRDRERARRLIDALRADPALRVGDNQPYSGRSPLGYSIPRHGRDRPQVMIELRQDLIDTHHGADAWAGILAAALAPLAAGAREIRA